MTTLIIQYNGSGQVVGRCDSRCYGAEHEDCNCICNGRNHGKGKQQAMRNNAQHALDIVCDWNAAQDLGVIDGNARPDWTWTALNGLIVIREELAPEINEYQPTLFEQVAGLDFPPLGIR